MFDVLIMHECVKHVCASEYRQEQAAPVPHDVGPTTGKVIIASVACFG